MPSLFCRAYMQPVPLQAMLGALQAVNAQTFRSIKRGGTGPKQIPSYGAFFKALPEALFGLGWSLQVLMPLIFVCGRSPGGNK